MVPDQTNNRDFAEHRATYLLFLRILRYSVVTIVLGLIVMALFLT